MRGLQIWTSVAVVITCPEGCLRQLYKGYSAPVLSIKAHFRSAFFFFFFSSFNAVGQMVFASRGCLQTGPGLQTQRELMSHAAG